MIPARLGSKRIKHKNLRLLDGKPLVSHVLDKCKDADIFSEIYINSESGIFKSVADEYGVKLYLRDPIFATDDATNDQFILDFINHIDCDIVVQVNPTSPLVQAEEIKSFVTEMLHKMTVSHGLLGIYTPLPKHRGRRSIPPLQSHTIDDGTVSY